MPTSIQSNSRWGWTFEYHFCEFLFFSFISMNASHIKSGLALRLTDWVLRCLARQSGVLLREKPEAKEQMIFFIFDLVLFWIGKVIWNDLWRLDGKRCGLLRRTQSNLFSKEVNRMGQVFLKSTRPRGVRYESWRLWWFTEVHCIHSSCQEFFWISSFRVETSKLNKKPKIKNHDPLEI